MSPKAKRAAASACALALALAAVLSTAASGQTVRAGNLIVQIDGSISPSKLPKRKPAPITLKLSGELGTSDGSHPPALSKLNLDFDRHGHLFTKGLPTCTVGKLENTLTSQARRACRRAIVGGGRVGAEIAFPEQAPFKASGPLLVFNGKPKGRRQVLIFHVHADVPAPTTFVTTAVIGKAKGRYGTNAKVKIPRITNGQGSLTFFRATLRKTWRFKGRKRSLLLASCPTGRLFARGDFIFNGGTKVTGKVSRSCRPTAGRAARPALASAVIDPAVTRQSYKQTAEPICKVNSKANERILKHVRSDFRKDKLSRAGRSMLKASRALKKTYRQLKALLQPPADASRLNKWMAKIKLESNLFRNAGKALKSGKKGKASAIVTKLNNNATKANNLVVPFGFRYCKFNPSKYT
jgi:hypothetical protein